MSLKVILSPAKKLKTDLPAVEKVRLPQHWEASEKLVRELRKYSTKKIATLMNLSQELANLNHQRYQDFNTEPTGKESSTALDLFDGEAYNGLAADEWDEKTRNYADQHLFILSGLYGIIRPLDSIQPYRLEMGTKLKMGSQKNLYEFWGDSLLKALTEQFNPEDTLINLASSEYSKVLQLKKFKHPVITPTFKEYKNGDYKTVMVYAKNARGRMTRFILENQLSNPEDLKAYNLEGYQYLENLSKEEEWVFAR